MHSQPRHGVEWHLVHPTPIFHQKSRRAKQIEKTRNAQDAASEIYVYATKSIETDSPGEQAAACGLAPAQAKPNRTSAKDSIASNAARSAAELILVMLFHNGAETSKLFNSIGIILLTAAHELGKYLSRIESVNR